nr:hypothetical protein [Marinicella sp. W31]MDC2879556.1 hypothetical protein [Marinicella sp. W31]
MAGALASLASDEGVKVVKALQVSRQTCLGLCRVTGLSVCQVGSATALLVRRGLVGVRRHDAETFYELAYPRIGDLVDFAEELALSVRLKAAL